MIQPTSKKPGKQRKWLRNAPHHRRRKMVASHLSPELKAKYGRRSLPVRKGDTVTVERGAFNGLYGGVVRVNPQKGRVYIEGLTIKKADGTEVERSVHASNLIITEVYLEDRERRELLEKKITKEKE